MIIYIDHSDVQEDKFRELDAAIAELVTFVDRHEPQLVSYAFYVQEVERRMTVVAVHPDAASLELHMEVAGEEFLKFRGADHAAQDRDLRADQRAGAGAATSEGALARRG